MMKVDPIIAVNDVEASAKWHQSIFGCKRKHGGNDFAIMVSENNEVLVCLHKWGVHEHSTMMSPAIIPGNGLILYFKTENWEQIHQNAKKNDAFIEEEIHLNPNSTKNEFSLRDPDGYYWTITEYHTY